MRIQRALKTSVLHEAAKVLGITLNPASGNFRGQRRKSAGQQELKLSNKRRLFCGQALTKMHKANATSSAGPLRQWQVQKHATETAVVIATQCGEVQCVAGSSWYPTFATPNPSFNRTHCGVQEFGL